MPLGDEINQVWDTKRYDPYLGWTMPDFQGRYLNVEHGVRRSYEPPASGTGRPLSIYFLGGSTMFGLYQRDEHTIPSEFARLAERDGIDVHVVNYGRLAYVNWQETLELQQLVSQGRAPDLAVFYDGFNEVLGQFQLGPHSQPTHLEAQQVEKRLGLGQRGPLPGEAKKSWPRAAYDSWADVSLVHRLGSRLGLWSQGDATGEPLVTSIWPGDQTKETGRRGALAASIYERGVGPGPAARRQLRLRDRVLLAAVPLQQAHRAGRGGAARLARHRRGRLARGRPRPRARASTPRSST